MNSKLLKRLALFALAALLLVGFAFVVARSGPLAPVQVTVIEAAEGRVSPALFGIGTVEARRAYLIGPTAPGRVLDVRVDVGETVRAGQLLAEMDPVDLDDRVHHGVVSHRLLGEMVEQLANLVALLVQDLLQSLLVPLRIECRAF